MAPCRPGELPEVRIPDLPWAFILRVEPGHPERVQALIGADQPRETREERHRLWRALCDEQEEVERRLWNGTVGAWWQLRSMADDEFNGRMERYFAAVATTPCTSRCDASRCLALIVWSMVAVDPWRHLAEIAGLPLDDASFITWAGRDAGAREALEFLAARREGMLAMLGRDWERDRWRDGGPGRLLATAAAAQTGTTPADTIRPQVNEVLRKLADDHQLNSPMANLLTRLDPQALDNTFGPDVAAELDHQLGLPAGTSGLVIRALNERLHRSNDPRVRCAADRSAQELPVVGLPDYGGWHGRIVIPARAVSGCLVQARLAEPDRATREEYLAEVRALWVPDLASMCREAA